MQVKAELNNIRISPRKVRLVADLIRGLDVPQAKAQLNFLLKKSAMPLLKLLNSAIANAKHNFKINDENNLYISEIKVNAGQTLVRVMPRAMGRASYINKRTSKILLVLSERNVSKKDESKKTEKKAKVKTEKKAKKEEDKKPAKKTVKSKKESK